MKKNVLIVTLAILIIGLGVFLVTRKSVSAQTTNSTPSLLIGDTTLYTIGNFFRQLLNSNLLPRFGEDMFNAGVKTAAIPSYIDGYAVAQVVTYPLYPHILLTTTFKFPLLSVSQTSMQSVMFTTVKTAIKQVRL